jgi:hypothetical protein
MNIKIKLISLRRIYLIFILYEFKALVIFETNEILRKDFSLTPLYVDLTQLDITFFIPIFDNRTVTIICLSLFSCFNFHPLSFYNSPILNIDKIYLWTRLLSYFTHFTIRF